MSKGRFHVVKENTVISNNIANTPHYAMIGSVLDNKFSKNIESCISCTSELDSLASSCSCAETNILIGGMCRVTSTVTDFKNSADGLSYFQDCFLNGVINVEYSAILDVQHKISLF